MHDPKTVWQRPMMATARLTIIALACSVCAPSTLTALDFYVAKTADTNDIFCASGLPSPPPFDCSLREAINKANISPGLDHIYIPPGTYNLTRLGDDEDSNVTGDLDIRDDLEIHRQGPGLVVIDGQNDDRVLDIRPVAGSNTGPLVKLHNLRIQNGRLEINNQQGAGVFGYKSTVHILECEVISNHATGTGNKGGGVACREGSMLINESTIRGNSCSDGGGGVSALDGILLIMNSTIKHNQSDGGSALHSNLSTTSVLNSTITDNVTYTPGETAGVLASGGTVSIDSCTLSNSWDDSVGVNLGNPGAITIRNTIISGTCASGAYAHIATDGGNIEGPGDTCGFVSPGDYYSVPVFLTPPGDYGGPTETMIPIGVTAQLAVDNIWADPNCLAKDQRGVSRPVDGDGDGLASCDSGSAERMGNDPLFIDGFETGDTSTWPVTVPTG
ncbi:MAG: right-handed parallel beta-helix repeat-containing protein [Thermoanaerobaculales bacterium]|nr:right-handed parallel beta-helix repeat-containing protein [Thermoanaerobaculales bacterium]